MTDETVEIPLEQAKALIFELEQGKKSKAWCEWAANELRSYLPPARPDPLQVYAARFVADASGMVTFTAKGFERNEYQVGWGREYVKKIRDWLTEVLGDGEAVADRRVRKLEAELADKKVELEMFREAYRFRLREDERRLSGKLPRAKREPISFSEERLRYRTEFAVIPKDADEARARLNGE